MDPYPQIPTMKTINDYNTVCLIRNNFEGKEQPFPKDTANNLRTYTAEDPLDLRPTANKVFGIYQYHEEKNNLLNNIEFDIIKQHSDFLNAKSEILFEKTMFLREMMKLKSCEIFSNIYAPDKIRYGLLEKCDLYPDDLRQLLDFKFNTSFHQCKKCFSEKQIKCKVPQIKERNCYFYKKKQQTEIKNSFGLIFEPPEIIFKIFDLKTKYEQIVKIKNTSSTMQQISLKTFPNLSIFEIIFNPSQRIAPGMYATCTIKCNPQFFSNLEDRVTFISRKGEIINLPIKCYREPPKLSAYIHKSSNYPKTEANENIPGSKYFSCQRQVVVNDTIDCGTCFATDYILISVILFNKGNKAKFFWLSEEDFYFQDIKAISTNMEYYKDCFWIYPTYFEMHSEEICEINIIFQPLHCGLYSQTLYLMCDNNSYSRVELVGDAICFNNHMVSVRVLDHVNELQKKNGHCIFMGHLLYDEKLKFTLSILNKSAMFLEFEFKFDIVDNRFSMLDWVKITNSTSSYLSPYCTTDVIFEAHCPNNLIQGYYNAKVRLFIKNIPVVCLEANEIFLVNTNKQNLKNIVDNLGVVDVMITEIEIACYVNSTSKADIEEMLTECENCGKINCLCKSCKEPILLADLEFQELIMEFGILPIGADIKKDFFIVNRGQKDINWTIIELKYNLDFPPHIEIVKEKNVSCLKGTLQSNKKQRLSYSVIKKVPARYVSILILYSVQDNIPNIENTSKYNFIAQSICIITYEIIKMDIVFKTQSKEAILCPMQMLYTEVPIEILFKIKNYSLISGCFYFLKPIGRDADKICIEYQPESGKLKAGGFKKIRLKLTCNQVGILEDIFIPCFIGINQEPIQLRLLCVVDCVHVFFYLPSKNKEFQKVLWPPKVIYEHDMTWSDYCLCEELSIPFDDPIKIIQSQNDINLETKSIDTLKIISNSSSNTDTDNILKKIESEDSDIFLQDYVIEVKGVKIKEARKMSIFFENVTPKPAQFSLQTTNYTAKQWKNCPGPKHIKTEDFWELMIGHSGIVIQPDKKSNYMKGNELVSADLWIYAKTWGIYVDEIIIDIENIASFSFSLVVEVTGCPLELPISIGAITQYPTIRFGTVTSDSEDILRKLVLKNISSIDVTISWHVYDYSNEDLDINAPFNFILDIAKNDVEEYFKFSFTDRFFGIEGLQLIEIQPSKLEIVSGNHVTLPIVFKPKLVRYKGHEKTSIRCFILGKIFTKENDGIKSSYFYRKPTSIIIEVTATVEEPRLLVEIEDDLLSVFANEVAFRTQTDFSMKILVRNPTSSQIKAELYASDPFCFDSIIELEPRQCKEIFLPCFLTYEKILKWANIVYKLDEIKDIHLTPRQSSEVISLRPVNFLAVTACASDDKVLDEVTKTLTFQKKFQIYYQGGSKQIIPIRLKLNYPNISVKPLHIKFGYILIGRTQKTTIIISNLTGFPVKFEIYKSCCTQELVVTPSFGEIDKSTGINKSFQSITVYFTPTQCKVYHESIRIVTNIPQYFIDLPVKGAASFNEKFDIS